MKIELKPNWDNAPEWAKYWAMDSDGECFWYEIHPTTNNVDEWIERSIEGKTEKDWRVCKSWQDTLQERPLILTNVARPSTLGDLRDIMTAGIESKLDRIIDLLSQKLMVDVSEISKDMKK